MMVDEGTELTEVLEERLDGHFASRGRKLAEVMALAVVRGSLLSRPPSGYHKVYNIYARKVNKGYHLMIELDDKPIQEV